MNKVFVITAIFTFAALAFLATMHVKNDVQAMHKKRDALIAEKQKLEESLKVLEAEYAYLSRPARLEEFAMGLLLQHLIDRQIFTFGPQFKAVAWEGR